MARYWDDVTGKELDPQRVREARDEEMKELASLVGCILLSSIVFLWTYLQQRASALRV